MGRIDFDSGYIYAENLTRIGRVDKSGYIYDEGLHRLGQIDSNGYVYDEGLRRIGKIDEDSVRKFFGKSGPVSGCFLSSACVEARGLPDDCHELTALRNFRDGYLRALPDGAVEISGYYRIAPRIVSAIEKRGNSQSIFNEIYEKLILPCVAFIENGENESAHQLYRTVTLKLERQFIGK